MTEIKFKPGDHVRVKPRSVHRWEVRDREGFVVPNIEADAAGEVAVRLSSGFREGQENPIVARFSPDEVHATELNPTEVKERIRHEIFMASSRRERAQHKVLEAVDLLVRLRGEVDKAQAEISLVQSVCPHEDEVTRRIPVGSFTAEYHRCKVCGREWADD